MLDLRNSGLWLKFGSLGSKVQGLDFWVRSLGCISSGCPHGAAQRPIVLWEARIRVQGLGVRGWRLGFGTP